MARLTPSLFALSLLHILSVSLFAHSPTLEVLHVYDDVIPPFWGVAEARDGTFYSLEGGDRDPMVLSRITRTGTRTKTPFAKADSTGFPVPGLIPLESGGVAGSIDFGGYQKGRIFTFENGWISNPVASIPFAEFQSKLSTFHDGAVYGPCANEEQGAPARIFRWSRRDGVHLTTVTNGFGQWMIACKNGSFASLIVRQTAGTDRFDTYSLCYTSPSGDTSEYPGTTIPSLRELAELPSGGFVTLYADLNERGMGMFTQTGVFRKVGAFPSEFDSNILGVLPSSNTTIISLAGRSAVAPPRLLAMDLSGHATELSLKTSFGQLAPTTVCTNSSDGHIYGLAEIWNNGKASQRFAFYRVKDTNPLTSNLPPIARDDFIPPGTTAPLKVSPLSNDEDANDNPLRITSASASAGLNVSIDPADNSLEITFQPGQPRLGTISYVIDDGNGGTATATVFVQPPTKPGCYAGLLQNAGGSSSDYSGFIRVQVTRSGLATGQFFHGGEKYRFRNRFTGAAKELTIQAYSDKRGARTLTLQYKGDLIRGELLKEGAVIARLTAELPTSASETSTGEYTALIDPIEYGLPHGTGWAVMKISPNGLVRVSGKTGDGTPVVAGSQFNAKSRIPFYAAPKRLNSEKAGELTGMLSVDDSSDAAVSGTLAWRQPSPSDYEYPLAFSGTAYLRAAKYHGPEFQRTAAESESPREWFPTNFAEITLTGGHFFGEESERLSVRGDEFYSTGDLNLIGLARRANGSFVASFFHPSLHRTVWVSGVYFTPEKSIQGCFRALKHTSETIDYRAGRFSIKSSVK